MQLVPLLDFGDEVGRKRLYTMLGSLLLDYQHTPPSLVPHLLAALSAMESSAEFVAFVGGVMRQVQASGEEKEAAEAVSMAWKQMWWWVKKEWADDEKECEQNMLIDFRWEAVGQRSTGW